jgi:amino acid transporter
MVTNMLLRIIALVAILVGAVVATAQSRAWWTVALAVAGLVIAACLTAASMRRLLSLDDDADSQELGRRRFAALSIAAIAAVVLAVTLPVDESSAVSTARPTAAAAADTVRSFLATAVLDDSAYAACQHLTPAEQQRVADLAGGDQTCRDALSATQPSLDGIHSEGALHALALHVVIRAGAADVTATPHGRATVRFVLVRTTSAQAATFEAPPAAWRIADGATAVLHR